ncbi:MAG: LemA family protein [Clostridiales bacterium 43-6]|nr:MAG: LemA family protein [Clostridiales bacterium 43-6]
MKKGLLISLGVVAFIIIVVIAIVGWGVGVYNKLVGLNEGVSQSWSQVENQYQRRYDLIPNLVSTVKGVANFEKETYTAVTEARAKVGQIKLNTDQLADPEAFQKFQQAQDGLSSALSRLLVVSENYPQLKANENFLQLQAQLLIFLLRLERQLFQQWPLELSLGQLEALRLAQLAKPVIITLIKEH